MKRTSEKTLGIISLVLSIIGVVISGVITAFFNLVQSDPEFQMKLEEGLLSDPAITPEQIELTNTFLGLFGGVMWFVIIGLIIGIVLTIIGLVNIWNDKNPKIAGIMFIIAGVLAGFISLPSILLYIAGILCLVRKPSEMDKTPFTGDSYDGTMRPL